MRSGASTRCLLRMGASALLATTLLAAAGCTGSSSDTGDAPAGAPSASSPQEAVRNFYASKTKHGFATFRSGEQPDERVEFWFDEDGRYRLTWYYPEEKSAEIEKYGPVRIHMISPDGSTVYYSRPESKATELAPVRAEKQQWTFNGPPDWEPDAGVEEGELTVFTYTPEKLWDIEGASQKFYLHDMRVYARGGEIERIVMRTSSDVVPVEDLVDSEFTIDEFELDVELPSDIFELPYPVAGE